MAGEGDAREAAEARHPRLERAVGGVPVYGRVGAASRGGVLGPGDGGERGDGRLGRVDGHLVLPGGGGLGGVRRAADGGWIRGLVEDYKTGFPDLYKPGQAKWLHDDYVKFIRWAEWRVSQTGYGVVAFITNNGYLDNPTFKGMRKHLRESFDDLYLLNLHGSTKKKETTPDGSADVNVFDIQQGVALGFS